MRILVTGAAGFIGFHLTRKLLDESHEVLGLDNLNNYYSIGLKKDRLKMLGITSIEPGVFKYKNENFTFILGDLSDHNCIEVFKGFKFDLVIHLAAQAGVRYSLTNPLSYINSNLIGFQNIVDFCANNNLKLIYASSSSVYGKNSVAPFSEDEACTMPESLYAATKRSNELVAYSYLKTKSLSSIGLRFFTVYGPWGRPDMAPMLFANAAIKNNPIDVYNFGNQQRDFTYIDDIVLGILECAKFIESQVEPYCNVFNIGRGKPEKLMDFINLLEREFNHKFVLNYLEHQKGDVEQTYANTQKLKSITGFESKISLSEGIKHFASWYKKYFVNDFQ